MSSGFFSSLPMAATAVLCRLAGVGGESLSSSLNPELPVQLLRVSEAQVFLLLTPRDLTFLL